MSWSNSAFSTALQCLRKYKYIYIDKLIPEVPESSDLVFGSSLHSAINAELIGKDGTSIFELYWDSYKNKELEYSRFNWEDLKKLGINFIRKFKKYHLSDYKLIFGENRLYSKYKDVELEGTPDFYGEYCGNKTLLDFKTSSRNYKEEKKYIANQLYLYAYLLKQSRNFSIDYLGYIVFNKATGSIQTLVWKFDENQMTKALDELVDYVEVLVNGCKYPKNYNSCLDYNRKCEFWNKCHG